MIKFLQTPGKTKKIILGGMLVLICGAMVVTLVPGGILGDAFGFGGVGKDVLAKVGDQEVTIRDVQDTARRMGRQQFGGRALPPGLMGYFLQNAAQQLIVQQAMINEARNMGLRVTDAELQGELQHGSLGPMLFPGGNFIGEEQYENLVTMQFNMSVPQFEELVKQDLLLRKLRAAVEGPVLVSSKDVQQEYRRQNTKVKFEYAVLTAEDLMKQVKPTDSELKAFYDSHKQIYANSIPEKRQVKYIVVDTAKVESQVQVSASDLQKYYQQHQDEFRVPEEVNLRQILIKIPLPGPDGKVDQKAVDAARAKAEDIAKQLKNGASFADLAKKYSEDPGSASNGGSLGWVVRGRLPGIEDQAFSMKPGETSGVIQSSYGFHIIHIDDKHQAHVKPLDEVKGQIEAAVKRDKAAADANRLAGTIETQARTQGIDKAAQEHQLQLETSAYVARTDTLPGVGASPEVMQAVFNAQNKSAPEQVQTPQGYVIFQVTDVKPPATPTFEEAKARVEQDFKTDRANQMMAQKAQQLADRAKAQHDLKSAAAEVGATLKTSDLVSPTGQVPDLGSLSGPASVVFTMKPGEISGPIETGRGAAVISLLQKQEPSTEDMAKGSEQVRESLLRKKRDEALELFASNLRARMEKEGKIRINKDEWNRILTTRNETGE